MTNTLAAKAAADPASPPWMKYVALLTGVLAALGGFLTVRCTNLSNQAIYFSNQAVLMQAQASDSWADYQANSIKARIVETQLALAATMPDSQKTELGQYDKEARGRQPGLQQHAKALEAQRDDFLAKAYRQMSEKDLLSYGGMAVQFGIALASVAALTKRKGAFYGGIIAAAVGVGLTAYALIVNHLMM
ncbi:MAG: DUF4337 family protein [Tepidisphaeraceae bacterium]|jgi:hypothetical protein